MNARSDAKKFVLERALANGGAVDVHFRVDNSCEIPVLYSSNLHLIFCYEKSNSRELRLTAMGVHSILFFRKVAFRTFVPWENIFLMQTPDDKVWGWPEDAPGGSLAKVASTIVEQSPATRNKSLLRKTHLRLVK